jgi:hypothetical protein
MSLIRSSTSQNRGPRLTAHSSAAVNAYGSQPGVHGSAESLRVSRSRGGAEPGQGNRSSSCGAPASAPVWQYRPLLPANRVSALTASAERISKSEIFGSSDGFRADARLVNTHPRLAETSETPFFWVCSTNRFAFGAAQDPFRASTPMVNAHARLAETPETLFFDFAQRPGL